MMNPFRLLFEGVMWGFSIAVGWLLAFVVVGAVAA